MEAEVVALSRGQLYTIGSSLNLMHFVLPLIAIILSRLPFIAGNEFASLAPEILARIFIRLNDTLSHGGDATLTGHRQLRVRTSRERKDMNIKFDAARR